MYQATGESGFRDRGNLINHKLLPYAQSKLNEGNKRLLTFSVFNLVVNLGVSYQQ